MIGVGRDAPDFRLPDTGGTPVERGTGPALVVFLPAAFTPVCSDELAGLAQISHAVEHSGVRVLGIGCDSMFALRTWAAQVGERAPTLLSDFWPHGRVSAAYEAFDAERGIATRASYLIDGGVVRWSETSPPGVGRDMREHSAAVERLVGSA